VVSARPDLVAVSDPPVAAARRSAAAPATTSAAEVARPLHLAQRAVEWVRDVHAHRCGGPAAAARGRQAALRPVSAAPSPAAG